MPEDLVRWNDLIPYFELQFPRTVSDVVVLRITAKVLYRGCIFEIRPCPGGTFDIYGPAHLFPEVFNVF